MLAGNPVSLHTKPLSPPPSPFPGWPLPRFPYATNLYALQVILFCPILSKYPNHLNNPTSALWIIILLETPYLLISKLRILCIIITPHIALKHKIYFITNSFQFVFVVLCINTFVPLVLSFMHLLHIQINSYLLIPAVHA